LGDLPGQELQVIGQGEENSQDQERETDDGDREYIPNPVLPEIIQGFLGEIFQLL